MPTMREIPSTQPLRLSAARIPSGTPTRIEKRSAVVVSSNVAVKRRESSLEIDCPETIYVPRSPWTRSVT